MTPIEQLRKDHEVIRAKLNLLENALTVGQEAVFAVRELVYSLGRRLAEHEEREEVQLYPVLHETLADPQREFAQSLEIEHEEHESLLHALHLLTLRGTGMPMEHVAALVQQLSRSLREHIDREERLLFPILERLTADREANARANAAQPDVADVAKAPVTVNRLIGMFPEAQQVFECHCIDCRREGADFLDEVAWRHAVPLAKLLRELKQATRKHVTNTPPPAEAKPFVFG